MPIILALTLLTTTPAGAQVNAPLRMVTSRGVELRADENVFVLFAALNALGYSEETERKGPPLEAPVFHAIRAEVRDAFAKPERKDATGAVRTFFDAHPAEIDAYLAAVLARRDAASKNALAGVVSVLDGLRASAGLEQLFDTLADQQYAHAKRLRTFLEGDLEKAASALGTNLRAPASLVVVPNPLDAHGKVRTVAVQNEAFLIVGGDPDTARRATLVAVLRPAFREAVEAAFGNATGFVKAWEQVRLSKNITRRWPDAKAYLAENLAAALAHRAVSADKNADRDEEFFDASTRQGLVWIRPAMRIVDGRGASGLRDALPRLLAKENP